MSELLALLTAKSVNFEGGQGSGDITPQLVAAACKDLPRPIFLYALLKYCQDDSVKKELYEHARGRALAWVDSGKWRLAPSESKSVAVRLVLLALRQAVVPRLCKRCNGFGYLVVKDERPFCQLCKATGAGRPLSGRMLAEVLGVSHKRVRTFWSRRYTEIEAGYINFDIRIAEQIHSNLREG